MEITEKNEEINKNAVTRRRRIGRNQRIQTGTGCECKIAFSMQ